MTWKRDLSRSLTEADLSVHGWRPVASPMTVGIVSDDLKIGFAVWRQMSESELPVMKIRPGGTEYGDHGVRWEELTDDQLQRVLNRMEEA